MRFRHATLALLCGLFSAVPIHPASAQTPAAPTGAPSGGVAPATIDQGATLVLDRMAEMIGGLTSVSFSLRTTQDVQDPDYGTIARFGSHQVYMTGPDHMHVNSINDKRHAGYWYNGQKLHYYSFTENNFGVMDAPDNIMATIEDVHQKYGVDFPAADFFYPTFTDDLIAQSTQIDYLGTVQLEGRECFRLVARGAAQTVQLWIANDATFLPVKYIITDHSENNARYEGTFSDWQLNPDIPSRVYDFTPPPGAAPVRILPRTPLTETVQSP